MPTLYVELPRLTSFYTIPQNCKQESTILIRCVFNAGRPLFEKSEARLTITIDTTRLEPGDLMILANVTSSGDESDFSDNVMETIITCSEFSEIETIG